MPNSYTRYTTEQRVIQASLIDKTKDVFAPGPDGRVAIRMIHEGEYLGGPVQNPGELANITNPIVGEFHFIIDLCCWAVWNGSEWCIVCGGVDSICAGDAIELSDDGGNTWGVPIAYDEVCIRVLYDPNCAIDLFNGKLGVKTDNCTIIKNASGELESTVSQTRTPHRIEWDECCRPKRACFMAKDPVDCQNPLIEVCVDLDYSIAGVVTATPDPGSGALPVTYTYNFVNNVGTIS